MLLVDSFEDTRNPSDVWHSVTVWQNILPAYYELARYNLRTFPPWFRMKLRLLHLIMFPTFLCKIGKDKITDWSKGLFFQVISSFDTRLEGLIYWSSIFLSCIGLIYVEARNLPAYKPPTLSQRQYDSNDTINLMFQTKHSHPLPQEYMVLSGVALLRSFTGWLEKIGKTFHGFISSMNRIGNNAIMFIAANCKQAKQRRSRLKMIRYPTIIKSMQKFVRLLLLTLCISNCIFIDALNLCQETKKMFKVSPPTPVTNLWDISLRNCVDIKDEETMMLNSQVFRAIDIDNVMCYTTSINDDRDALALHNTSTKTEDNTKMSFGSEPTEFGTDNCATHHICSRLDLFTSMKSASTVGVTGVVGSIMASGIGTIQFTLLDSHNKRHVIKIDNVIYLPESAKNLISTSQWASDKKDDCGVLSRGTYSVFMWDHDKHQKYIPHAPSCPIPMMPVNETDETFALFNTSHSSSFPDNGLLLPGGVPNHVNETNATRTIGNTNMNKQFIDVPSSRSTGKPIAVGSTVWCSADAKRRIAIITDHRTSATGIRYTIRPLNSKTIQEVEAEKVSEIKPSPDDIPSNPTEVDIQTMTECLSKEDLERLWSGTIDNTINKNEQLALYWHHRLRHAPLTCLHRLAKRGTLPKGILLVRKLPLCAACAFASAHRRSWRTKAKTNKHIRKTEHNAPGKGTSCDHIVSHQPGLIPQSSGILTHEKFWGSVLFVDHHSDFVFNRLIIGTTSQATLDAKQAYERIAASYGIRILSYRADNSRFNDRHFQGDCVKQKQTISFCGVGAHHQNAIAESKVKAISYGARTILLHAKRKWPKVIGTALWPFAMQAIVDQHNRLSLDESGRSPIEKFSNTEDDIDILDFHTWGCPVYILNAANQGAIGTPKWDPRAHLGIYLGHSPQHARSVALVLNLRTGHCSPQFHVIYDEEFSTIPYISGAETPPNWETLCNTSIEHNITDNDISSPNWLQPQPSPTTTGSQNANIQSPSLEPITPVPEGDPVTTPSEGAIAPTNPEDNTASPILSTPTASTSQNGREDDHDDDNNFVDVETLGLRRSNRVRTKPDRMSAIDKQSKEISQNSLQTTRPLGFLILAASIFMTKGMDMQQDTLAHCYQTRMIDYHDFLESNYDGTRNATNPLAQIYLTSKANNEVYTLKEMLAQPDRNEFLKAMKEEVQSLFDEKIWKLVQREEMTRHYNRQREKGITVNREQIMMIWSFKRKRHPDGSFKKCKARLCCHGGQQQLGVNFWDTYSPVVSWSSVRILLTLAKLHNLHTQSVDFVQAYPQADIKYPIYLKVPAGVILNDNDGQLVLKLMKNLYGLKDAGRTWYEHLTDGLTSMGFIATSSDPCIFTKGSNVIILYVDDCVIISKTKEETDVIYKQLEQRKYKMTNEGTMEEYLGIQIDHHNNSDFRMSQPFLIERIVDFIPGMAESNSVKTPACSSVTLTKDIEGENRKESWDYRAIVGMLNYLVNCTHPELSFAVHQCARFCNNPKRSHEQAIKRIIRYLRGSMPDNKGKERAPQGILFRPDKDKSIETYVDASFAGDWNISWSDEPSSVMSRTGYVILYANCPIIWSSKLQTEIALSTTESEYIALSQSMRDVIPLMGLLKELQPVISFMSTNPVLKCKIFEDNKGCFDLVTTPKIRPRTKHITMKYHHFRSFVQNKTITIEHVDTKGQIADIFTKALSDAQFVLLQMKLMGNAC